MTIQFYLKNNEEETEITSFPDLQSNPFNIGDEIFLNVDEIYPNEFNEYDVQCKQILIKDNEELEKRFKRKKVKIIKEYKYITIKVINEPKLVIEFTCEFVDQSQILNKNIYVKN